LGILETLRGVLPDFREGSRLGAWRFMTGGG
jgi:hypothetical protein